MPQFLLPLVLPESFSASSFFVSECNKEAFETVLDEKNWQAHTMYLYGEKDTGKTHLSHIWQQHTGATFISSQSINPASINGNCIVEDIENCPDELPLLHLFNHCKDIGVKLLMTSVYAPSCLPFTLPDLTSRLRACQAVTIYQPDDEVIANAMRKQFSDRQLLVDDEIISYLAARTERTLASVKTLVEILDKNALAQQRNITIPFVKQILGY